MDFPLQCIPRPTREQIKPQDPDQPTPYLQLSPAQLYNSLPVGENRTIRLLDLDELPDLSDADEEPLSGSLRVVSLTTRPSFTALSYVWGTYSTPHPDILELRHSGGPNVKLKISTNCQDALRALRRMHGNLCIWVDAICINQDDNAEKETQIKLMEDIYSWATEVYAWLGPSTAASDRVMDWARRVAKHDFLYIASATHPPTQRNRALYRTIAINRMMTYFFSAIKDVLLANILLPYSLFKPEGILKLSVSGICYWQLHDLLSLDDFQDMSNRKWFRRIWTFQEAVLSSNLILICGSNRVEWAHVVTAIRMSRIFGDEFGLHSCEWCYDPLDQPTPKITGPLPIIDLVDAWIHTGRPVKWEEPLNSKELQLVTYASWLQEFDEGIPTPTVAKVACMVADTCQMILYAVVPTLVFVITFDGVKNLVLERTIEIFSLSGLYAPIFIILLFLVDMFPLWREMALRLKVDHEGSKNTYLAGVLQTIRIREATDERDRSYAAYGVLQRLGIKSPSQPDYSKPLGRVYEELIRDLLQWSPATISMLLDAGVHSNIEAPSWVPDWSVAPEKQWIRSQYIVEQAINPTSVAWLELRGDGRLTVKGIQIGSVGFSSGTFRRISNSEINPPTSVDIDVATNRILHWLRYFVKGDVAYLAYRDFSEVVANVLDAEIDSGARLHLITRKEFCDWYELLIRRLDLQESVDIELEYQGSSMGEFGDNITEQTYNYLPGGHEAKQLTIEICNHLAGRRGLFATTSGLVGSGPEATKHEDIVMLISGIPVPMILREVPCDDGETNDDIVYRIIGPAYIYGALEDNFEKYGENITLV